MSLNIYDYCPCGSGKKIKFCKCHEYLNEMDKIKRMVDGEQYVAALDQINAYLKSLPSEPWLLAFKCDVLLRLGEIEPLEEASAKFIRLQPDNPLAKLNRSMVALVRGSLEEAASLYLQAISSSSLEVSALLMNVISNLLQLLMRTRQNLPAYLHLELAMDRFEGIENLTAQLSANLLQNQSVNMLCRDTIPSPPNCDDQEFAERYREAIAMMYAADLPHAKTKLEGIQREFGAHPAILIALLHCKLYLVDTTGAAETCLRLSSDASLSTEQRAYYYALAIELNAAKASASCVSHLVEYQLDDESAIEAKIQALPAVAIHNDDENKSMVQRLVGEEVPPKLVADLRVSVDGDEVAYWAPTQSIALVAVFGKQTDKPARLVMLYSSGVLPKRDAAIQSMVAAIGLGESKPTKEQQEKPSYLSVLAAQMSINPKQIIDTTQVPDEAVLQAFAKRHRISEIKQVMLGAFNGKTLEEAAKDKGYQVECIGFLLHVLASGLSGMDRQDYLRMHADLGLEIPKVAADQDGFDLVGAAYYYWADLANLPAAELGGLARSAMQRQHGEVFPDYLQALENAQGEESQALEFGLMKKQLALSLANSPDDRLALIEEYYETLRSNNIAAGEVGIAWFQLLMALSRTEQANQVLMRIVNENKEDPAVREFVYMLNMEMERMRQAGAAGANPNALQAGLFRRASGQARAASSSTADASRSGGIWTPDQAAPQAASSESGGGSGLWIPGQ